MKVEVNGRGVSEAFEVCNKYRYIHNIVHELKRLKAKCGLGLSGEMRKTEIRSIS